MKLSVIEGKLAGSWARNCATTQQVWILKFAFGIEKFKGAMSHNTHARANANKLEKDGPTFSSCVGDFRRLFYLSKSQPSFDS